MKSRPPRSSRAFSLIEVMVALLVFVMMAVVLAASYMNVLKAYEVVGRAAQRDEDVRFARATLLAETDRDTAEKGGEFDGGNGRKVRWKSVIEQTSTADLFQVTFICEINAPDLPKPEIVQENLRLLRPTWSKTDERDRLRASARERFQKMQIKKS